MAVSVVSFSFSRAAQPEAQGPLCWVIALFIASYQQLLREKESCELSQKEKCVGVQKVYNDRERAVTE